MKTTQSIIESILSQGESMTSREIYDAMEPNEKGFFAGGVDAVGKCLYNLRDKGLLENGISEIVNGRTVLTWKMKNAQILQKPQANKSTTDIQDAPRAEEIDQQATVDTQEVESVCVDVPVITETQIENVEAQVDEALGFHDMIDNFGAGVNAFIAGTRQLLAELEESKAEIERLKAALAITNKRETIAVLKHVQGFVAPINEDFDAVIGDIVQKIEAMPEAA